MATKEVDEATTRALLNAFGQCAGEVNSVGHRAEEMRNTVTSTWAGGAATTFGRGVDEWLQGLERVKSALSRLDDSMNYFASLTANTEDDIQTVLATAGLEADASWAS